MSILTARSFGFLSDRYRLEMDKYEFLAIIEISLAAFLLECSGTHSIAVTSQPIEFHENPICIAFLHASSDLRCLSLVRSRFGPAS